MKNICFAIFPFTLSVLQKNWAVYSVVAKLSGSSMKIKTGYKKVNNPTYRAPDTQPIKVIGRNFICRYIKTLEGVHKLHEVILTIFLPLPMVRFREIYLKPLPPPP